MATQNRTTKPQPTQGSAAARQAAQAPAADAAKMAKQAADKAELDKMAQAKQAEAVKEVVAETTAEGSVATADAAAAAEGSLGAVSGEAAVAEAGAAGAAGTAAAISPLAIGAGVVGVVAVAAAAGGGSSGGSSSQPIAQNNNQQAAQNQGSQKPATPAAEQPAQDTKPAEGTNKPAEGAKPTEPAKEEEPAKQADSKPADQPKVDPTPVEDLTKPATAAGTAAEPKVAADGVTNLTKFADLFETAGANGGKAEYIKISRILSAENAKDAEARAVDSDNSRAYEVIDAGKPITLAEAQTMAAKLGGKLMSIDTAEEKAWLDKNLFGALGEYDGDKSLAEAAARGDSDKAAQQKVLNDQLASNGAWLGKNATEGADAKANAVIRNGNNAEGDGAMKLYEAAGTTLSKFVIEYEGYKSPLLLDGKPVVEGQIINKADAAKLAWNADLNKGGQITYQAVDSNDANAQPVANAKEGKMTLSESAGVKHPMTTPVNPSAQDKPAQGGTEGKPGNDVPPADKTGQDNNKGQAGGEGQKGDHKAPEGGNKTGNPPKGEEHNANGDEHKADAPQNNPTGGDANKGNTNPGGSDTGGAVVKPNPAGGQQTGTPDVQTGGPDQPPVKAAPSYEPNKSVSVAHDATNAKIAKEVFEGTNPANKPEAVKATGFAAGTLKVNGQAINPGDKIDAENFDKVTWDASKGEGGTFKFTPVQANGNALQGATEQTITINEASAPVQAKPAPTYDANKTVDVAHDATDAKIAKEVFEGTTPANKPAAVTVTGFTAGTLKVNGAVIADGAKIDAENFDKVTWDASKGEGGTFKFTPVQANGNALQGATEQTITINEAAAAPVVNAEPKVGVYSAEAVKFDVAHDAAKTALLTKDSQTSPFAGTDAEKAPDAVKIVSVHGPDGQNTHANIMTLGDGGTARNLAEGQFIDKADFSKVQWNADVDHGSGTYKVQFVPVTSDHKDIANAQTQTFTVKEAAEQPDYSTTTFSAAAEHNGDATFGKAMFDGTDAAKAPMYIRITEINPSNTEAGDKALYLDNKPSVDLKVDATNPDKTILAQSDFEHLRWNAAHNEGGTFKFTVLDGDMKPIDPSVVHTVTVTESPSNVQALGAADVLNPQGAGAHLKSMGAYTPAEPSSNLLDDLHNQITPLI